MEHEYAAAFCSILFVILIEYEIYRRIKKRILLFKVSSKISYGLTVELHRYTYTTVPVHKYIGCIGASEWYFSTYNILHSVELNV